MTTFPKYDRYKDTGVEWLGEVPEHWGCERGKWVFTSSKEINRKYQCVNLLSLTMNGVLNKGYDGTEGLRPAEYNTYQVFEKNDLVFKLIDLENYKTSRVGIVHERGIMSPVYLRINATRTEVIPRYYYYLYYNFYLNGVYNEIGSGVRSAMSAKDLLEMDITIPTKLEQDRIVAFLDHKTAEIDSLIAKKQRQIELLDEQKAILINRTVTSGLNPNAKLKPSGIEWIGDIPEHWEVKRIGHLGRVGNGSTPSRSNLRYWDKADYPWLNSGSVNQGVITEADQFVSNLALKECHLPLVRKRSIVIAITGQGKTRGTAALLMVPATINQHLAYIEIESGTAIPEFVHLTLTAQYFQLRAISESGSTKGALTCQDVKEFKIALPPVEEQQALIATSQKIQKDCEAIASKFNSQIQSLQTLRSTLIAHAVTGRIKV